MASAPVLRSSLVTTHCGGSSDVGVWRSPVRCRGGGATAALRRSKSFCKAERYLSSRECCTSGSSGLAGNVRSRTVLANRRAAQGLHCMASLLADEELQASFEQFDLSSPGLVQQGYTEAIDQIEHTPYSMDMGAGGLLAQQVGAQVMAAIAPFRPKLLWFAKSEQEEWDLLDRGINGLLVGFVAAAAAAKVLTIDHDIWAGWTFYEIVRNIPRHNWLAYEAMLAANPIVAKMVISGVVYTLGDWSAQRMEGRGLLGFDRGRMIRSGLVGFCFHGSLSHYYYHVCEALFPGKELWVVPLKVLFDQTVWAGIWNSIYYICLGLLRFESPSGIWRELKGTFVPLLTAGWKLWPFAHIITYGVIPLEQRLLWVDLVELVWVTILSMMANERAEARRMEEEMEEAAAEELAQTSLGLAVLSDGSEAVLDAILWPGEEGQEAQEYR